MRTAFLLCLPILLSACTGSPPDPGERTPPNIVFILADDLGYGDPACFNADSRIPTPHIDRLAREGMRFTDAHAAAAVCIPTRYGLMTGRYPFRMKGERGGPLIDPSRMTIASLLREEGYATGMVGKWHLGFTNEKNPAGKRLEGGPVDRGFDRYFGIPASLDIPPYYYIRNDRCTAPPVGKVKASRTDGWSPIQGAFWRGGGLAPDFRHEEVLPRFRDEATTMIRKMAGGDKPFFLYLALPAPHPPWLPDESFRGKSGADMYGDFVMQVDDVVGRVLKSLDDLDHAKRTLLIFTSDNGPVWYPKDVERFGHSAAGPFRGMKGDAWEAGHRVPFIVRWPGRVRPGTTSGALVCHNDMMATFASLLGRDLPDGEGADSFDMMPLLGETGPGTRREAVLQSSRGKILSLRMDDWKLIPERGSCGFSRPSGKKPEKGGPTGQLYHLGKDPAERRNLHADHPDRVSRLTERLAEILSQPGTR